MTPMTVVALSPGSRQSRPMPRERRRPGRQRGRALVRGPRRIERRNEVLPPCAHGRDIQHTGQPAAKMVAELAVSAGNPDADSFLKQAAILHADVAAYVGRAPIETRRAKGRTTD